MKRKTEITLTLTLESSQDVLTSDIEFIRQAAAHGVRNYTPGRVPVELVNVEVAKPSQDERRYRLLRSMYHQTSAFAVVQNPRDNVKLGAYLPYEHLLDEELDELLEKVDGHKPS